VKLELLDILRCPNSGKRLIALDVNLKKIDVLPSDTHEIVNGFVATEDEEYKYPVVNKIPRFVPESNYADNFGLQWNIFSKTQLDSNSGHPISANRFWKSTNWDPNKIKGTWVLDVGCGSGRFAEIALSVGAKVVALDYSSAVDACFNNLSHHPNLHVVQGNIYELPFVPDSFSYIYSLGVLQHTPDVSKAFFALPPLLLNGGQICVDFYEKTSNSIFLPKYLLRPLTKDLNKKKLFSLLEYLVPMLLFISNLVSKVPLIGKYLRRLVPVANYSGLLPLSKTQLKEWALLDTFDWLSPAFDNPQTPAKVVEWFRKSELKDIEIFRDGHLIGRGIK
jgi:ubiquinone/menaquinone biosynthesis C-methylase UbiE